MLTVRFCPRSVRLGIDVDAHAKDIVRVCSTRPKMVRAGWGADNAYRDEDSSWALPWRTRGACRTRGLPLSGRTPVAVAARPSLCRLTQGAIRNGVRAEFTLATLVIPISPKRGITAMLG